MNSLLKRLPHLLVLYAGFTVLCLTGCGGSQEVEPADGTLGMVSTAHPLATEAGLAVLEKGGNAFDAAVATAAALNVVEPAMSGMGGYGTIMVFDAEWEILDRIRIDTLGATPHQFAVLPDGRIVLEGSEAHLLVLGAGTMETFAIFDAGQRSGLLTAAMVGAAALQRLARGVQRSALSLGVSARWPPDQASALQAHPPPF